MSLEAPIGEGGTIGDLVGGDDQDIELVEQRESLKVLMRRLPEREQQILNLRYYGNLTQDQIASRVGLSQMHVSRLLHKSLEVLRRGRVES